MTGVWLSRAVWAAALGLTWAAGAAQADDWFALRNDTKQVLIVQEMTRSERAETYLKSRPRRLYPNEVVRSPVRPGRVQKVAIYSGKRAVSPRSFPVPYRRGTTLYSVRATGAGLAVVTQTPKRR